MATKARIESNIWLRENCKEIEGRVLSIGSLDDSDGEGKYYRDYFLNASEYLTSEVDEKYGCDLILDVTNMKSIKDCEFDSVFCGGVLEHVFEFQKGLNEITRILKKGGILLLGLPFNQPIHMEEDYWRFTDKAIYRMLSNSYEILDLAEIFENKINNFPTSYLVKASKYEH